MKKENIVDLNVNSQIQIQATPAAVFNIVSDHTGTPTWVKEVKEVKLLQQGTPKNGKGAIREVNFRPAFWSTVQERIISYEDNKTYSYKIVSMPGVADHLGIWAVADNGDGSSTVSWQVYFGLKKRHWFRIFFSKKFATDFKQIQENALLKLKEMLEK